MVGGERAAHNSSALCGGKYGERMSGNGVPILSAAQAVVICCDGCKRRSDQMVHFNQIANVAFIPNRRNGHEYNITNSRVRYTDLGVEATGGTVVSKCRRCGGTTTTLLDTVV